MDDQVRRGLRRISSINLFLCVTKLRKTVHDCVPINIAWHAGAFSERSGSESCLIGRRLL